MGRQRDKQGERGKGREREREQLADMAYLGAPIGSIGRARALKVEVGGLIPAALVTCWKRRVSANQPHPKGRPHHSKSGESQSLNGITSVCKRQQQRHR